MGAQPELVMTDSTSAGSSSPSENGAFERWRRKVALITGLGVTEEERMRDMEEVHHRSCEKWKSHLMQYSECVRYGFVAFDHPYLLVSPGPSVVFMLKRLELTGCQVSPDDIRCGPCDYTRAGGFDTKAGSIILCSGRFFSKGHMENTLVHELVHMYDHCKFKVDWNNLRHHACSEVSCAAPSTRHNRFP